jgi:hypothetical protein
MRQKRTLTGLNQAIWAEMKPETLFVEVYKLPQVIAGNKAKVDNPSDSGEPADFFEHFILSRG